MRLSEATIESLARELKAAQDCGNQVSPLSARHPEFDLGSAYAIAHRIHRARIAEGAAAVGRKLGFTNRNIWDEYGVHRPIWGHLYDRTTVFVEPARPGRCRIGHFAQPKIEPEIVLHFGSAPPRSGDPAAILKAVDWVAHGFEIVQSHFPDWKFQVADTVADSALHAMLLVGAPRPIATLGADVGAALASFTLRLSCNGEVRDTGTGANVLGSPLAAVAHLVQVLSRQPGAEPLAAGEMVTTGTVTAAHAIRPGETWRSELFGVELPGLCVEFVD